MVVVVSKEDSGKQGRERRFREMTKEEFKCSHIKGKNLRAREREVTM